MTRQGYIRKMAPTVFGRSHRRWFVLDADTCTLRYYEDEAKAEAHAREPRREGMSGPKGEIDIRPSKCAVHGDGGSRSEPKLDLVTASGRTYVLVWAPDAAGRADERAWWVALLGAQARYREAAAGGGGGGDGAIADHNARRASSGDLALDDTERPGPRAEVLMESHGVIASQDAAGARHIEPKFLFQAKLACVSHARSRPGFGDEARASCISR